jgi:hypothetical protein
MHSNLEYLERKRHEDLTESQTATVQEVYAKAKEDMVQRNIPF